MISYHENQTDETYLDNEPLLQLHNRSQLELTSKLANSPQLIYPTTNSTNSTNRTLNASSLFDESDCLIDLSPSSNSNSQKMESPLSLTNNQNNSESDNSSDYENLKLDENGNIRYVPSPSSTSALKSTLTIDGDRIDNFDPNADIAENLLAIFVVSFDAKLGNMIEWQVPADVDLKHIEFKAMASGFHLISNDLV